MVMAGLLMMLVHPLLIATLPLLVLGTILEVILALSVMMVVSAMLVTLHINLLMLFRG
jgi:hypothetical protein